jgi:cellobiose phosphorylase
MLVLQYVRETGDVKILKKKIKFFDGGSATLYEHAKRATMFLQHITKSKRGLPLMGTQDWNDAFDMTGVRGKGESVWLGMGLCVALNNMKELAGYVNDKIEIKRCGKDYEHMKKLINKYAWDGGWYVYAFNDFGEPIGSRKNKESKIQLNSQTWAIMAGLPDCDQLDSMLKVIDNDLDTPYGPVLFTPCYTQYSDRIGRITAFAPGTKENAAIFSHGGAFKVVSDLHIGRAEEAYETFKDLLPMDSGKDIEIYKSEPYVLAEYLIGPGNPRCGEGAFTWLTGSSDWLYVAGTEHMLGIKPQVEGLLFDPCIPSEWKECKIKRVFRGAAFDIAILNPKGVNKGVKYITVNGKKQDSPLVKLAPGKGRDSINVEVIMG